MSDYLDHPMTTNEFYTRLFLYRLDVFFAAQRYAIEAQALRRLKADYNGHVPQELWEKQRRRVLRASLQLGVRRSTLTVFLKALLN
jgi:hypothetical protein